MAQYTDTGGGRFQANFTTEARPGFHFRFRRWHIEPYTSFEMPETEMVFYRGRYLSPRSFEDEVVDDQKRRR